MKAQPKIQETPVFEPISVEHYRFDGLNAIAAAWQDLADHASEPNYFYTPGFALAAARHLFDTEDVRAAAIWASQGTAKARLIGLFPYTASKHRWGVPVELLWALHQDLFGSSAPLLRAGWEREAVAAFFGWIEWSDYMFALFPELDQEGAAFQAIKEWLERTERPYQWFDSYQRSVLESPLSAEQYRQAHHSAQTRAKLQQCWRRLQDKGVVEYRQSETPEAVKKRIEAYLALDASDASSWTGRVSGDIKSTSAFATFAREALTAHGGTARCRVDELLLDGQPIAVNLTAISGPKAWSIESCYDQRYADDAPDLLIYDQSMADMLGSRCFAQFDAAEAAGFVTDDIWAERKTVGNLLFASFAEMPDGLFSAVCRAERLRCSLRDTVKAGRGIAGKLKAQFTTELRAVSKGRLPDQACVE